MSKKPDTFRYFCSEPPEVENKCIFCKISNGSIKPGNRKDPTELIFENDRLVAFDDINPGAARHLLVVTKEHYKNCWDPKLTSTLLDEMDQVARQLLERFNKDNERISRTFFIRPPFNSVYHIHLHVMIGELTDPWWDPRKLGFQSPWFHITPTQLKIERDW
jgi:histidine triad (HIT) family protein